MGRTDQGLLRRIVLREALAARLADSCSIGRGICGELRRITLLRGWLNKGLGSLVCRLAPEPGGPSCDDCGYPYGYELAYSVPCATHITTCPKKRHASKTRRSM